MPVDAIDGHQLVEPDTRSEYELLLRDVLRAVGIEVDPRLQQVQTGETADPIARLDDTQPLFGKRHGVAEVLEPDFLLDEIVVLGRQRSDEILDRNARLQLALSLELLQAAIVGPYAEALENRPFEVESRRHGLVVRPVFGGRLSGSRTGAAIGQRSVVACRKIERRQGPGCRPGRVRRTDPLVVAGNANRVIALQARLQTGLQRIGSLRGQDGQAAQRPSQRQESSHAFFLCLSVEI